MYLHVLVATVFMFIYNIVCGLIELHWNVGALSPQQLSQREFHTGSLLILVPAAVCVTNDSADDINWVLRKASWQLCVVATLAL